MTKIEIEDLFRKPSFLERLWVRVSNFKEYWVWPAHYLRNFFYYRFDLVRLRRIRRWEYCDVVERMLHANMELVREFVEEEKPERHVCWYRDEDGHDVGHKYGEAGKYGWPVLYPEYKGMYIMDIIKEIYNWWKTGLPKLEAEYDYLLDFNCKYVYGKMKSRPSKTEGYNEIFFDTAGNPASLEFFEGKDVDWGIMDKYCRGDRGNVLDKDFMREALTAAEKEIELQKQKYLHLCVEVRQYLWT